MRPQGNLPTGCGEVPGVTTSEIRRLRDRLRSGDPDAFEDLYAAHERMILAYAYHLTASWPTAEDVTAETFLSAWQTRERLRDEDAPLTPWLYAIATHKAMNATRSARRRMAFLARSPRSADVPDFADDAADRIDAQRAAVRARRLLDALPRHEAEVLVLSAWAGLSYEETATALGIPLGTVRSRLSRGRARLRALIDDADPDRAAFLLEGSS